MIKQNLLSSLVFLLLKSKNTVLFQELKNYRERVELEKQRIIEKKRLGDNLENAVTPDERKKAHDEILN